MTRSSSRESDVYRKEFYSKNGDYFFRDNCENEIQVSEDYFRRKVCGNDVCNNDNDLQFEVKLNLQLTKMQVW